MIEALENLFMFVPTPARVEWLPPPSARIQDVRLTLPRNIIIHGWWYPPENWDNNGPVLLYLHGNGGNLSHRGPGLVRWQQESGAAILIVDYPGYGHSTGRPSEALCYAAADAAYAWLTQEQHIPAERLMIYGGSLGGAVAVDLASRVPHRALILVGTFTSVHELGKKLYPFLPVRWIVHNHFNSLAKIGRCRRPVFIAHGTADSLVPFAQAEKLFSAANEPKHFFPLVGYDHHHAPGLDFYNELRAFLAQTGERGA